MRETIRLDGDEDDLDATAPASGDGDGPRRSTTPRAKVAQGESLGRYRVLELIGTGGMGVVYRVYDPDLDREIALKLLLLGRRSGGDSEGRRARMVREAQALARLSHPNVVGVFDVGALDGDPYIAMEFVEGPTLTEWLQQPRSWREIVQVFVGAGHGLVAAHAQGIVHRDFKFANVLVGTDGRPRVLDFGLARPVDSAASFSEAEPLSSTYSSGPGAMATELTRAGVVMGTPKSMSPEQHTGAIADERSDQYSFCVALFEALFGLPPFAARRIKELARLKQAGRTTPIPDSSRVPPRIRKAVMVGLSPKPEDRWPNMEALLRELSLGVRGPRRWPWVLGLGLLGAAGWIAAPSPGQSRACPVDELAERMWNASLRERGASAFDATGLPYAAASWERVDGLLATYVGQWRDAYRETCRRVAERDANGAELDRTVACLRLRSDEVVALTHALVDADAAVVERAVQAAAELPAVARCAHDAALGDHVPPPSDAEAEQVAQLRTRLAEAAALQATGKFDAALAIAGDIERIANELEYRPLRAEARLRVGLLRRALADGEAAEAALTDAYLIATEVGHPSIALRAATQLVTVVGVERARFEEGHQWARHAEALRSRAADGGDASQARLTTAVGGLLRAEGKFAEALAKHRAALETRERLFGPGHLDVAASQERVGQVLHDLGRMSEAIPKLERALELRRNALGPEHPDVARSLSSLAYELYIIGDAEGAIATQSEALEIRRRVLAPDHPDIAESLSNLGRAYGLTGKVDDALRVEREALGIRRTRFGDAHPAIATSLSSIGITLHNMRRWGEALDHQRRALEIREKALGPEHPHVAMVLINMGFDLQMLGRNEDALASHRRADAIVQTAYGEDHLLRTYALTGMGDALMAMSRPGEAVTALREAVSVAEARDRDFLALGQARFALARALWAEGKDRDGALALANRARGEFTHAGEPGRATVQAMDEWLQEIGVEQ